MRRFCSVVFVVVLLLLQCQNSTGVAAHSGYWRVADTAGNGLRVRSGPGGSYRILEVMPRGRIVKARGHRSSWLYLTDTVTGVVGWASLSWLVPAGGQTSGGGGSAGGGLQLCWDSSFSVVYCAAPWIAQTIYDAAVRWGVPYWAMMGIASCESGFDPYAYNPQSGVSGIFQFQWSTMSWINPGGNVWSVYDSANAAAKLLAYGYSSMFDCSWRIGY